VRFLAYVYCIHSRFEFGAHDERVAKTRLPSQRLTLTRFTTKWKMKMSTLKEVGLEKRRVQDAGLVFVWCKQGHQPGLYVSRQALNV